MTSDPKVILLIQETVRIFHKLQLLVAVIFFKLLVFSIFLLLIVFWAVSNNAMRSGHHRVHTHFRFRLFDCCHTYLICIIPGITTHHNQITRLKAFNPKNQCPPLSSYDECVNAQVFKNQHFQAPVTYSF